MNLGLGLAGERIRRSPNGPPEEPLAPPPRGLFPKEGPAKDLG
jgi:hypothetical protein